MRLTDLLSARRVVVPLPAATLEEGVRILVGACVADGRVGDAPRLDEAIRESFPQDTMSLGPFAWLPHFRTDAVAGVVVALGIAPEPVSGAGHDGPGPRMILLIVASPKENAAYLQTVAAFARALARPEVAERLLACGSAMEVLALPALREVALEGQLRVRDLMRPPGAALRPDDTLADAARQLQQLGVEALPVVGEGGQLLGLLSYHELLRVLVPAYVQRVTAAGAAAAPAAGFVRDAMARTVLCVSEDQTLADVAHLLDTKAVERVPVLKDGALRGILTRADLVRRLLASR